MGRWVGGSRKHASLSLLYLLGDPVDVVGGAVPVQVVLGVKDDAFFLPKALEQAGLVGRHAFRLPMHLLLLLFLIELLASEVGESGDHKGLQRVEEGGLGGGEGGQVHEEGVEVPVLLFAWRSGWVGGWVEEDIRTREAWT